MPTSLLPVPWAARGVCCGRVSPLPRLQRRWPEAVVQVCARAPLGGGKAPTDLLPIAGGAKHGQAPTYRPSVLGQRGRPRARGSLGVHGHSLPLSGWAARAISAKGLGTGAIC